MNVFKFTNKSMGSVVPRLRNFKLVDSREKRFSLLLSISAAWNMFHPFVLRFNHVIPLKTVLFSVVLSCDVDYDGDAHFEAEVGTSFANVKGVQINLFCDLKRLQI